MRVVRARQRPPQPPCHTGSAGTLPACRYGTTHRACGPAWDVGMCYSGEGSAIGSLTASPTRARSRHPPAALVFLGYHYTSVSATTARRDSRGQWASNPRWYCVTFSVIDESARCVFFYLPSTRDITRRGLKGQDDGKRGAMGAEPEGSAGTTRVVEDDGLPVDS